MLGEAVRDRPIFGRRAGGAPTYARGKRWPAAALLAVPFILLMAVLLPAARRLVHWRACWLTVLTFEALMLPVEHFAVLAGFWVYNERRILGPLIWGVPIEEPLIYYLLPPVFVAMVFELSAAWSSGSLRSAWRTGWRRLANRHRLFSPR